MKKNKTVVIGMTGSIAAYKIADVVSRLKKLNIDVQVIMTSSAAEFISPMTLRSLSHNPVITDMFEEPKRWDVEHIAIAQKADLFLVAPATANIIGKMANGLADDMLSTTVMATKAPVLIAPAMNTNMYLNPVVQMNIDKLKELGHSFIEPDTGRLACGDVGAGKLAPVETIVDEVVSRLECPNNNKDLKGKKILITAGPTREHIDPVRFITNHSTGKMGYALAEEAAKRGAEVTLISGPVTITVPKGVKNYIKIDTAEEMYNEVMKNMEKNDIIIKTAAVADYKPLKVYDKKIKKSDEDMTLQLTRNKDIIKEVGKNKADKILVGFAAETNDLIDNAKKKLESKNLDLIIANDITMKDAGFGTDTNVIKIIKKDGSIEEIPKMQKKDIASIILNSINDVVNKN